MTVSRRTVLAGALVTTAATALPTTAAHAEDAPIDGTTLPSFGPACLTAAVVAMAVDDGRAYVISRGIVPPRLTEIDLTTRRVTGRSSSRSVKAAGVSRSPPARSTSACIRSPTSICFDPITAELTGSAAWPEPAASSGTW